MDNENILKGYEIISKPGEVEPFVKEITWNMNNKDQLFKELIKDVTGDEEGKITNMGYLPSPLADITAFVDYDQFNPDTKYNFNFFGNPIYNNIVFLMIDINSEDGKIIPIDEKTVNKVSDFIKHFKQFELDSNIYNEVSKTDKIKFLDEFLKEKNSVLEESVKDNTENTEEIEIEKAKKELSHFSKEEIERANNS